MFWLVLALLELVFGIGGAYLANRDGWFWPNGKGLTFTRHIAPWLDMILIVPLMASILTKFYGQWNTNTLARCAAIGIVLGVLKTFGPDKSDSIRKPTFIFHDGHPPAAGWLHLIFTACAITCILLVYTASKPSMQYAITMSVILGLHVAMATIQPAGLREAFNPVALSIIFVTWLLLYGAFVWLTRWRLPH